MRQFMGDRFEKIIKGKNKKKKEVIFMKKYWFCGGALVILLLVVAACAPVDKAPVKKDSAGKVLGDPTGRVFNPDLSCVGYCSGYAASGNEWCFCDAPCQQNKNCCSDIKEACPEAAR